MANQDSDSSLKHPLYKYLDPHKQRFSKKFEMTDVYLMFGVFLVGFIFALVLASYYKIRQEKIEEINRKFQGLKGEYELVQVRLEKYVKWRYRMKIMEKVYYIGLLVLGFFFYKKPELLTRFFVESPHLSIPFLSTSLLFFTMASYWLDKATKE